MNQIKQTSLLVKVRCPKCHKMIGEVHGDYRLWCRRCKLWAAGNTDSPKQSFAFKNEEKEKISNGR